MEPMSLTEFATIKALCAAVGLVIFVGIFVVAVVWSFRPGAKTTYQGHAQRILNDEVKD